MSDLFGSILEQVHLSTIVDIGITSLLIYWLFSLIRGTRAVRLVIGVSVWRNGRDRCGRLALGAGRNVAAERGDLDCLQAKPDVREAEAAADDPAVPKELLDLVGMRRGADVEVLRPPAKQQVAHAAADQVRRRAGFVKPIEDFQCI